MRALLLAALLAPSAAFGGDLGVIPADWNRLEVPLGDEEIEGLRKLGFRLEPDGRVLDLELKVLDADGLSEARRLLHASDRRQKLERLRAFLATQPQDAPLSADARREAMLLADGRLYAMVQRNEMTAGSLSRLARLDLNAVARVFDGNAAKASVAVTAPETAPANRPRFPYLTAAEQRAGEAMRAAAVTQLSRYERGRLILSRLDGKDGQPDLPPILVESAGSGAAMYDPVRRAVIIDREAAVTELLQGERPAERAARRRDLERPDALAQALAANPDIARRLMEKNDVLVAHELTHAWQDRRDSVWKNMRKGRIPQAVPFEYEEEANLEKNLYIHDVLRANPGADIDPQELADYTLMMSGYRAWRGQLRRTYVDNGTGSVQDLSAIRATLHARREAVQKSSPNTDQDRRKRLTLLLGMQRGERALDELEAAHAARIRNQQAGPIAAAERSNDSVLALHYLEVAARANSDTARITAQEKARRHALASGDAVLIERVQSQTRQSP